MREIRCLTRFLYAKKLSEKALENYGKLAVKLISY